MDNLNPLSGPTTSLPPSTPPKPNEVNALSQKILDQPRVEPRSCSQRVFTWIRSAANWLASCCIIQVFLRIFPFTASRRADSAQIIPPPSRPATGAPAEKPAPVLERESSDVESAKTQLVFSEMKRQWELFEPIFKGSRSRIERTLSFFTKAKKEDLLKSYNAVDDLATLLRDLELAQDMIAATHEQFNLYLNREIAGGEARSKFITEQALYFESVKKTVNELLANKDNVQKIDARLRDQYRELENQVRLERLRLNQKAEPEAKAKSEGEQKAAKAVDVKPNLALFELLRAFKLNLLTLEKNKIQVPAIYSKQLILWVNELNLIPNFKGDATRLFGLEPRNQERSFRGLYNIGYSCYINSAFAAFNQLFTHLLANPLTQRAGESEKDFKARQKLEEVTKTILHLYNQPSTKENDQALNSALFDFRFTLFENRFHPDFVFEDKVGYSRQHDASVLMDVFLSVFDFPTKSKVVNRKGIANGIEEDRKEQSAQPLGSINIDMTLADLQSAQKLIDAHFSHRVTGTVREQGQNVQIKEQIRIDGAPAPFLVIRWNRFKTADEADMLELEAKVEQLRKTMGEAIREECEAERLAPEVLNIAVEFRLAFIASQQLGFSANVNSVLNEIITNKHLANGNYATDFARRNALQQYQRKVQTPVMLPDNLRLDLAAAYGSSTPVYYEVCGGQIHDAETPDHGHYVAESYDPSDVNPFYHHNDNRVPVDQPQQAMTHFANAYLLCLKLVS